MRNSGFSRRRILRTAAAAFGGCSVSGYLPQLAAAALGAEAAGAQRPKSCIVLWMSGGPSQIDTFDMKPGHPNGGEFAPIATSAPGISICEHLPQIARHMHRSVVIRSLRSKEGDHSRATFHLRTGYPLGGPIKYPAFGAVAAKELQRPDSDLPAFFCLGGTSLNPGAGFLGPQHAPLIVNAEPAPQGPFPQLHVRNLQSEFGVPRERMDERLSLLHAMQDDFLRRSRGSLLGESHRAAYAAAERLMRSRDVEVFDLDKEPAEVRERYGQTGFGQSLLLARRLVERGVPFIEVVCGPGLDRLTWDTHGGNFKRMPKLCGVLDRAWASLLTDLANRGLLDSTLVVRMGEFGRTPKINRSAGRDHFPAAWSVVLSGAGLQGGTVIGATSADGMQITDRPVAVADLFATICLALGLDPMKQNMSNVARPIRLADPNARPLREILPS